MHKDLWIFILFKLLTKYDLIIIIRIRLMYVSAVCVDRLQARAHFVTAVNTVASRVNGILARQVKSRCYLH